MGKPQQTAWLAGFIGLSAACTVSLILSSLSLTKTPPTAASSGPPHALLAANSDQDPAVTLTEVRVMLEQNFASLDSDKDGLITKDEYAGRHIRLFTAIDTDQDQRMSPAEVLSHTKNQGLLHTTAYR